MWVSWDILQKMQLLSKQAHERRSPIETSLRVSKEREGQNFYKNLWVSLLVWRTKTVNLFLSEDAIKWRNTHL